MYNPYAKGRWYRSFIETDGTHYVVTDTDFKSAGTMSGSALLVPHGFRVVDYVVDAHNIEPDAATTWNKGTRTYASGMEGVILPDANTFDHAYVYVFGYVDE